MRSAIVPEPVSPNGYHAANVRILGDELLLILTKEPDRRKTAVYMYQVKNGTGRFVAQDFAP